MATKVSMIAGAVLFLVMALAATPILGLPGSRTVADGLCAKGRAAFKEENFQQAADLYREALAEFTPHPEAAFGLGEALEELGQNDEAMLAYLACKDQFGEVEKPDSGQKKAVAGASKAIAKLGGGYADLEQAEAKFVKTCISYAGKYKSREPEWAKRALEIALALEPNNSSANKAMKKLGSVRAAGFAGSENLIDSDALTGWTFGEHAPRWKCRNGLLRAEISVPESLGWALDHNFRGNLTIRWEARVVATHDVYWQVGMVYGSPMLGGKTWSVLIDNNDDLRLGRMEGGNLTIPRNKLLSNIDVKQWHRYELVVSKKGLTVRIDGDEIFTHVPGSDSPAGGVVGLFVQEATAEFRVVGVIRSPATGGGGGDGDEASAEVLVEQGAGHLASGEIAAARQSLEKALLAKAGYLPALLVLAEVELNEDHHDLAMSILDECLDREGDSGLSKAENEALSKAQKLYRKEDRPRLELREVVMDSLGQLRELEAAAHEENPALARRCLQRFLLIWPEHGEAMERLGELAPPAEEAPAGEGAMPPGDRTELFNGRNTDGWFVDTSIWTVSGGAMQANPGANPSFVECRVDLPSSYTLEVELRAGGSLAGGNLVGVLLSMGGPDAYAFAILGDGFAIVRQANNAVKMVRKTPYGAIPGFSPGAWHTVRLVVNGGSLRALVDGTEVGTLDGLPDDALTGSIGLWAQRVPLMVKRVSVVR